MKKRIFSIVLALGMCLSLAVPALAREEEPEYRLTKVTVNSEEGVTDTTFVYDNGGWLPTQVQMGDAAIALEYDDAGRVLRYQTPGGNMEYTYDGDGLLTESLREVPENNEQTRTVYTYDENGQVIREEASWTDGTGAATDTVTEYAYDEHGNRTSRSVAQDGAEPQVSTFAYEYDDAGQAVSETYNVQFFWGANSGTYTFTYDDQGRRTGEIYDEGETRYYYAPMLTMEWSRQIWTSVDANGQETGQEEHITVSVSMADGAGQTISPLTWYVAMTGEAQVEYDDNGCLVKAADEDGNMIELAYEPVA